jgi:hypothetical protein
MQLVESALLEGIGMNVAWDTSISGFLCDRLDCKRGAYSGVLPYWRHGGRFLHQALHGSLFQKSQRIIHNLPDDTSMLDNTMASRECVGEVRRQLCQCCTRYS